LNANVQVTPTFEVEKWLEDLQSEESKEAERKAKTKEKKSKQKLKKAAEKKGLSVEEL
jgi:hypothetical protein